MASSDIIRETWATRIGFILAAVGSAVGLGNIWRFPFQVGQEGGAAFLVMYLAFVVLIGVPAILVEFVIGRRGGFNPVGALREVGGGFWPYIGGMFIFIGFLITSYYSVVAGWIVRYVIGSATGGYMDDPVGYFGAVTTGPEAALFHALFMLAVIVIVAFGVQQGIELSVKVMVPAIILLVVGLAIYAATLPDAGAGYAYYLSPDLNTIVDNWQSVLPAAAGQAFFTLSLGMGVMITYASYLGEDRNLVEDTGVVVVLDTLIAFLTGLIVFPLLFSAGIDPAEPGAGAIFLSLAEAFGNIPAGGVIGAIFFATVAIAALSSAISLMEVVVSYLVDEHGVERTKGTVGIGVAMFLLGLPVTYDIVILDLYDVLASQILLVLGGLLLSILVGWRISDVAIEELSKGIGDLGALGQAW
ncbi:MAG: sodium-dependent transporter, partial [Haloferacaceae archaeon]